MGRSKRAVPNEWVVLEAMKAGVKPESQDVVDTIRGVGGIEYVYTKNFDAIHLYNVNLTISKSRSAVWTTA